ncbi:MAG TPA: hypothetical protein VF221_03210 [Chloroflexota bacterium]
MRESSVRRAARTYVLHWYRCRSCHDVSFSYRLIPDVSPPGLTHDRTWTPERTEPVELPPEQDPALSR